MDEEFLPWSFLFFNVQYEKFKLHLYYFWTDQYEKILLSFHNNKLWLHDLERYFSIRYVYKNVHAIKLLFQPITNVRISLSENH